MGSLSDDVYLTSIHSVETLSAGYVTIARLNLETPSRLGGQIEFFPLLTRNAVGENAVVADLRARIVPHK